MPENLLDNTDFVPQLFKFLEQYNMNLPTTNIPQFPLNTLTSLSSQSSITEAQSQTSSRRGKTTKQACDRKNQEEKSIKMKAPLKEVPTHQASDQRKSGSVIEKEEASKNEDIIQAPAQKKRKEEIGEGRERVEIRDETGGILREQWKDEENVVQSSENGNAQSGIRC